MGQTAEAAVYSYVGISLFSTIPGFWSVSWIAIQFCIIVFGRIIGVFCTFYLFSLCFRKKTISFKELIFISYGGMIRGAIAFALVLTIPHCGDPTVCFSEEQYELAKSTTLIIVMSTTLLFGTFMKAFQTWLLGGGGSHQSNRTETQLELLDRAHSVYEEIQHPNMDEVIDMGSKR